MTRAEVTQKGRKRVRGPEQQTVNVDLAGSNCRLKITFVWSTGSTRHIVKDRNLIYDFVRNRQVLKDFFGNKTVSEGYGKLSGIAADGQRIVLEKVFYLKMCPPISLLVKSQLDTSVLKNDP